MNNRVFPILPESIHIISSTDPDSIDSVNSVDSVNLFGFIWGSCICVCICVNLIIIVVVSFNNDLIDGSDGDSSSSY